MQNHDVGVTTLLDEHMTTQCNTGVWVVLHPDDHTDIYWDIIKVLGPFQPVQPAGDPPFVLVQDPRGYAPAGQTAWKFQYNEENPDQPFEEDEGQAYDFDLWIDGQKIEHHQVPNVQDLVGKALGVTPLAGELPHDADFTEWRKEKRLELAVEDEAEKAALQSLTGAS